MGMFSDIGLGELFSFKSGGSKMESEVEEVHAMTPEQQTLMKQLVEQFTAAAGGPVKGIPDMFVPTTDEEQSYFDWVGGLGDQDAMQKLLSGEPAYDIGPEWAEAMFEDVYLPEREEQLREQLNVGRAETAKWRGSPSQNLLAKIQADFAREVPAAKTQFQYTEEQARRSAIDQALGRAKETIPMYTGILGEAGGKSREIEQERVASILNQYLLGGESDKFEYNPAMNPNVQIAMSLLGLNPYEFAVIQDQDVWGEGMARAGAKSFLGGMGGGMAASDQRVKRNIKRIGKHPCGVDVVEFEYLWSPQRYIGVIADELLAYVPEVVSRIGGILHVDYSML